MFDDLTMKRCPICQKEFDTLSCDQWVYKRKKYGGGGYRYYCSWHCMRADEKKHDEYENAPAEKDARHDEIRLPEKTDDQISNEKHDQQQDRKIK